MEAGGNSMEEELKCRNTASSASGLSFARCWLRAEAAAHFAPYVNPLGSFFEKIWVRPTIRD